MLNIKKQIIVSLQHVSELEEAMEFNKSNNFEFEIVSEGLIGVEELRIIMNKNYKMSFVGKNVIFNKED